MRTTSLLNGFDAQVGGAMIAAVGAMVLARAVCLQFFSGGPWPPGPRRALMLVRAMRAGLVGGALVGVGAGLIWEIGWLVALSLIIGGQELLETSVMAAALRDEVRRRQAESRA